MICRSDASTTKQNEKDFCQMASSTCASSRENGILKEHNLKSLSKTTERFLMNDLKFKI